MALLTQAERARKLSLRAAAHTQQVRLDAESKRLLNNATANISPVYWKLIDLLDARTELLAEQATVGACQDTSVKLSFEEFKIHQRCDEHLLMNTAAVKKLLPTLTKHLKRRYKLHPLFFYAMKDDPRRVAVFKELLNLTPPDILKEFI